MESISQISPYEKMASWASNSLLPGNRINRKKKSKKSLAERFQVLTRMAHDTHQRLVEQNSPVRLCVYQDKEQVLMDVVTLDTDENVNTRFSRSITHEKLQDLVRQIHHQMGLVLDYRV